MIIVSEVDEISVNRQQLSPPHRIFRLQTPMPKVEFEEAGLSEFFHTSINLLKCGISAEKLASVEQISTEQVQLYLYKLSILGLVAPGRRDDLWAQLDAVLSSKSTPLKLSEASKAPPTAADLYPRRTRRVPWTPNRGEQNSPAINQQRRIANLLAEAKEIAEKNADRSAR